MLNTAKEFAKEFAINLFHQKALGLIEGQFIPRLIDIYSARYGEDSFSFEELREVKRPLFIFRERSSAVPLLKGLGWDLPSEFSSDQISTFSLSPTEQLPEADCFILGELSEQLPFSLSEKLRLRSYSLIAIVEQIDYAARERIVRWLSDNLLPELQRSESGRLIFILTGVEKIPPPLYLPPYEDVLSSEPKERKSQKIRRALDAWVEVVSSLAYPLDRKHFYPVAWGENGELWGKDPLLEELERPEIF